MNPRRLPLADQLRIASPCENDEGTSFCTSCQQVVHDIASLTRDNVLALLRSRRGSDRLCVRVLRRKSDHAVILADGIALPASRLAPRRLTAAVATMSAAALAGCSTTPPRIVTLLPNVASPGIGALPPNVASPGIGALPKMERTEGPVAPPLPEPPPTPIEAWLDEEASGLPPGESARRRRMRELGDHVVEAWAGSVEVTTVIPPYWPSWP